MTKTRTLANSRFGGWKRFSAVALLATCLVGTAGCASPADEPAGKSEPPVTAPPVAEPTPAPEPAPAPAPAKPNPVGTGAKASATIDNSTGGKVALPDGTELDVPAGALPPGVDTITITSAPEPAPADYSASSPVFVFEPDGTVFLKPVKVSMPVTFEEGTNPADMTVLWSRATGDGFDMVPTSFDPVAGSSSSFLAVAEVTHFSKGFCGKKYSKDPRPAKDPYADK